MLCETVAELSYRGWDVLIKPLRVEETCFGVDARIPLEIKDRFVGEHTADWEITLAPLDRPHIPTPGKKAIYWTMWEHDRLASWQSAILNKCEAVIVPTEWMRTVFKKTIKVPIHVVPLGINPTIFLPTNLPIDGPCVFGAAGCLTASAKRKNLGAVVNAFNHVFKNVPDVELRLKIMPGETFDPGPGPIRVNAEYAPWSSVARWLHGLTAFVNVGTEGWGLLAHQSMACGRPVIAPLYGGITGFFNRENGYVASHKMEWSSFGNRDVGAYAEIDVTSLSEQMVRVYLDRREAAKKSLVAARDAQALTWINSVSRLEEALHEIIQA